MTQRPASTGFDPARLIAQHQAGVWRYLRALGCDPTQAEDLTQETFLTVLEKPFDDYNPAATGAYLRKVAHNLFITAQRKLGRMQLVENAAEIEIVWNRWMVHDNGELALEALQDCLRQLTERARWALEMRFREHRSRAAIAEALEISEHGAKNLMQRAKKQLRLCVDAKVKDS